MVKKAYFAGGCFWCITPIFKIYGVDSVIVGYSGGTELNPTYQLVKSQTTKYRETLEITYNDDVVSYDKLLKIYLANIDPYDPLGQYIDKGYSYTLAIFYNDELEKEKAIKAIKDLENNSKKKSYISLEKFTNFYINWWQKPLSL